MSAGLTTSRNGGAMPGMYKELDEAICGHLEKAPDRHPIYVDWLLERAAHALGREMSHGDEKEWRLIDRRLQALRKSGRIRYVREAGLARWEVV